MDKDLLDNLKQEYVSEVRENLNKIKRLQTLGRRKEVLEDNPIIQVYLKTIRELEEVSKSISDNDSILNELLNEYKNTDLITENDDIYFYKGTYYTRCNDKYVKVSRDSSIGEFDLYYQLNSDALIQNSVNNRNNFEHNNKIVFADEINDNIFNKLRLNFYRDCFANGEELAKQRVLKKI